MNRRGFLGALAGAIAGATLDPERALWRPGAKLISIPPVAPVSRVVTPEGIEICVRYVANENRLDLLYGLWHPNTKITCRIVE